MVALVGSCCAILGSDMLVVRNLVTTIGEEGFAADVALVGPAEGNLSEEVASVLLVIPVHRDRLLLQSPQLLNEPDDAILAPRCSDNRSEFGDEAAHLESH